MMNTVQGCVRWLINYSLLVKTTDTKSLTNREYCDTDQLIEQPPQSNSYSKIPGPWVRKPRAEEVCYSPTIMRMSHPSAGLFRRGGCYQ